MTPGLESLIPFVAFWFVAIMTPGPNTLLFTWLVLSTSRRAAIAGVLGILSCGVLWALGGLFGLVWLMRLLPGTFRILAVIGGLYVVWRGLVLIVKLAKHRRVETLAPFSERAVSPLVAYRMGFFTNLANPKSLAFVASLFASTSVASGPLWLGLTGVVIMLSMSATYYFTLLWLFSRPRILQAYRQAQRWIEAGAGCVFLLLGSQLAFSGLFPPSGH